MKIEKCKDCGTEMMYNYHYHCYQCGNCEATYNVNMQRLRKIEEWKDEYDYEDYY